MYVRHVAAAVAVAALVGIGSANAQDFLAGIQAGTGKLQDPKRAGDVMLRLRGLAIDPQSDGKINSIGGDVDVSTEYTPEVDLTYFVTDHAALELIAEENAGHVDVVSLDVDANPETTTQFGIRGLPTLMLFKAGQMVASHVGLLPKARLKAWLAEAV